MRKIVICLIISFLINLPAFDIFSISFDTREIIDSYAFPPADKHNPEVMRNISLTLSAYSGYCNSFNIRTVDNFEKQIKDGKTKIYLNGEKLTYKETQAIAFALKINRTVTYIAMNDNFLGDAGALSLANMILENNTLKTIELNNCCIGEAGIKSLLSIQMTKKISDIKIINLSPVDDDKLNLYLYLNTCYKYQVYPQERYIIYFETDKNAIVIPYIIDQNIKLTEGPVKINADLLTNYDLTEELKVLSGVLNYSKSIKYCFLSGLNLTNTVTGDLLNIILNNENIINITIKKCCFDDANAGIFFAALGKDDHVESLAMQNCVFSDFIMNKLVNMLKINQSIKNFSFTDNTNSTESSLDLIKALCFKNETINYLVLKGMVVSDDIYLPILKNKFPGRKLTQ